MNQVRNDPAHSRYELSVDGGTAFAAYRREGDTLVFTHTEVPSTLEGRGVGSALMEGALADVRSRHLLVRPDCPFVAALYRASRRRARPSGVIDRRVVGQAGAPTTVLTSMKSTSP